MIHRLFPRSRVTISAITILIILSSAVSLLADREDIRLNQTGFSKYGPKTAAVVAPKSWYFSIRDPVGSVTYYTGELTPQVKWATSAETLSVADFSGFTREGTYSLFVEGTGSSYTFTISDGCFEDVTRGLIRAFYYQRCSTALPAAYAGKWARAEGHPDNEVIIHPSAASDPSKPGARHAGEVYPSPKGWYDAGDYGKYTVNAGISTYELLLLYEAFSDRFDGFSLGIPESGNDLPDILDEVKWELDWLLTMQDPADGGVYHKVTDKSFIGDLMPAMAGETRYFIGKAAPAAFDFAAVLAAAYRVYKKFRPSFADSCLAAARCAWEWGTAYPDSTFRNPSDVVTGEYRDANPSDEMLWAGFELFIATGDSAYFTAGKAASTRFVVPAWPDVALLGCYSMGLALSDTFAVNRVLRQADELVGRIPSHPYRTIMLTNDFYWGSNGVAANQGVVLLMAYLFTRDLQYLEGAIHAADYILGRNATGYCFVTGYGAKSPMFPHHRPSTADHIAPPVPGLLVGGPNPGDRSGENCSIPYPKQRAKSYLDNTCSFTTNEVAINWNAPAALLAGGLDAILQTQGYDVAALHGRHVDSIAPSGAQVAVSAIGADRATVSVTASEPLVAVLTLEQDDHAGAARAVTVARSDSSVAVVDGLMPGTLYRMKVTLVDESGNSAWVVDSFTTAASSLSVPSLYDPLTVPPVPGSDYAVSFEASGALQAELLYTPGSGREGFAAVPFVRSGATFTSAIPAAAIGAPGITCKVRLFSGDDTVVTVARTRGMRQASVACTPLTARLRYRLVSVPGILPATATDVFFGNSFGDPQQWTYYGYDADERAYVPFDTIRTATGGWLYHEKELGFSATLDMPPPDSLVAVHLDKGWNCIGNPFLFPVYWDNMLVEVGEGVAVPVTDAAAGRYVRRQFFTYVDSTPDKINNGVFATNRDLFTHAYDDSATLEPWSACWMYAERDAVTCLIRPSAELPSSALLAKKKTAEPREWFYRIALSCGNRHDDMLLFGRAENAEDGYDLQDVPAPPAPSSALRASFLRTDADGDPVPLMTDMCRLGTAETGRWTLDVASMPGEPLVVTWAGTGTPGEPVWLLDETTGYRVSLMEKHGCTLPAVGTPVRTISLVQGTLPEGVTGQALQWRFSVTAGVDLRFSYDIPFTTNGVATVQVAVYDIYGRELWRVGREHAGPGSYLLHWDGMLAGGTMIAQGYYIVRLQAGAFSRTVPLRLVR